MTQPDLERAHTLMMAALDGEITAADRRELDGLIAGSPALETEWRRLLRVKEVTSAMTLRTPPEEVWDRYWISVYRRGERALGWLLLSAGVVVLAAYGLWRWFDRILGDTALPIYVRVAVVGLALGAVVLLLSVVREKLVTRRRDPYRTEVTR
jgi:ferric-dicitrate binding protein FerR (iron transport regulator)